jgi:hypothetical protein
MDTITKQLNGGTYVHIDFKMSKLKPHIYHWLYKTLIHVSNKINMISKRWEHAGLLRAFDSEFQKQTMMNNMVKPLFNIKGEEKVQATDTEWNEEIDVEVSLDTVTENNLSRVAELSKTINSN